MEQAEYRALLASLEGLTDEQFRKVCISNRHPLPSDKISPLSLMGMTG